MEWSQSSYYLIGFQLNSMVRFKTQFSLMQYHVNIYFIGIRAIGFFPINYKPKMALGGLSHHVFATDLNISLCLPLMASLRLFFGSNIFPLDSWHDKDSNGASLAWFGCVCKKIWQFSIQTGSRKFLVKFLETVYNFLANLRHFWENFNFDLNVLKIVSSCSLISLIFYELLIQNIKSSCSLVSLENQIIQPINHYLYLY